MKGEYLSTSVATAFSPLLPKGSGKTSEIMTRIKKSNTAPMSQTRIEGTMTFVETENKMHLLDFVNDEDVMMTPFTALCKVQAMRDGNVYITEKKHRVRNKPIFREDHSSLSLGHDGIYYFTFRMTAGLVDELPDELVRQALAIAQKVNAEIINKEETL